MKLRLNPCTCGSKARMRVARVAEDAEECWAECVGCGAKTEAIEDAYADYATAAWQWNRGVRA